MKKLILITMTLLMIGCGPGQNVFESMHNGVTNIIKNFKDDPQTLNNPKLAHVKRFVESAEGLMQIKNKADDMMKRIIDRYEGNDDEVIDIVLDFARDNDACLRDNALDDEFYRDKQKRGGYLGWTLPTSCEDEEEQYKEFRKRDRRILQRNLKVKSTECTHKFPASHNDIRSDRHYINSLNEMYAANIKCYKTLLTRIEKYD